MTEIEGGGGGEGEERGGERKEVEYNGEREGEKMMDG